MSTPIQDTGTRVAELTKVITAWAENMKILRPDEILEVSVIIKKPTKVKVTIDGYSGLTDVNLIKYGDLGLSIRAENCLNNSELLTVGDIRTKSYLEIYKYRNFGRKTIIEVYYKLKELGIDLPWVEQGLVL